MAMEISPTFAPPALSLAEMLIESRQYAEAMSLLGEVTDRLPTALAPRLLQLRVLIEVGEKPAALGLADALKKAATGHGEVAALWAEAMLLNDRGAEAKADIEELIPKTVADEKARLLRIVARIELSAQPPRFNEAVDAFGQAITASQAPGELRLELAQLHLSTGDAGLAATTLVDMANDPRSEVGDLLSGAVLARNHGMWDVARQLATFSLQRVAGTPAEGQVAGFIESLPPGD
jgi:Tfp pilus assembly protein PilF